MNTTYSEIVAFYGKSWESITLFDLTMVISHVSMSIGTGAPVELSFFDNFIHKRKNIKPVDRADACGALVQLSQVLRDRVENMPQAEKAELDRIQAVLNGASAQTVLSEEHQ